MDWSFASSLIASRGGPHATWPELRSVDTALCFLYELFGPLLPASTTWPSGIADYCKWRGWTPDRLKAALFPTVKALDAFLVLALANSRLMPNVDSVLYYAFVGCVTDTDDSALVRVRFEKFRGGAADNTINKRSSLALALRALESVVVGVLGDTRDLSDLYRDGGVPLYCIVLGDRGGRGACSTDGKSPNFANRTDQHCAACGNFLLTSRSIGYWQASFDLHSEVLRLTKIEVVKKVAIAAMESAKHMLKSIGAAR